MRILVTGGAGKAGRHVIEHLISGGHRVLNVDLAPCAVRGVFNRIADITDLPATCTTSCALTQTSTSWARVRHARF